MIRKIITAFRNYLTDSKLPVPAVVAAAAGLIIFSSFPAAAIPSEGFESGINFPWRAGGDAAWTSDAVVSTEGVKSAKSGAITHNQKSSLEIFLDVTAAGNIKFYRKTSSESGYDFLRFYMDGIEQGAWSGENAWEMFSYPVNTGLHTFRWEYSKNGAVSSGSDAAWVDGINFPTNTDVTTGTVSVSTFSVAPAVMGYDGSFGLLKLSFNASGGNAVFNSLMVDTTGSVPVPLNDISAIQVFRDSNGNGVFEYGTPGDLFLGEDYPDYNPSTVYFRDQIITPSSPAVYFVAVRPYPSARGRSVGFKIQNSSYTGVTFGSAIGIFPADSPIVPVKTLVPANPPAVPSASGVTGGYNTNIYLNSGQTLHIISTGTWNPGVEGTGPVGPGGTGGPCASCVLPSAPRGALIGHTGTYGAWELIGTAHDIVSTAGDNLYLAMNGDPSQYYDNTGRVEIDDQFVVADKKWTGGSNSDYASDPANWLGNALPAPGDNVVFDGVSGSSSSKACNWNISVGSIKSLSMGPFFSGIVTLNTSLTVIDSVTVQGGSLNLSYYGLTASTVAVGGSGTVSSVLDMAGGYLYLGPGGLVVDSLGTFKSEGANVAGVYKRDAGAYYPVAILGGTVSVKNTMGTSFSGSKGIEIFTAARINAMDYVKIYDLYPGTAAFIPHVNSGAAVEFNNWYFDSSVSSNVTSSYVSAGGTVTMKNASGPKMGTPNEDDVFNRIFWNPEGGGSANISGNVNYGGPQSQFIVKVSTSSSGEPVYISSNLAATAYSFTSLNAPNTYYFTAFRDVNVDYYLSDYNYEPRGSTRVFLANGASPVVNIPVYDVGIVSGTITKSGSQTGKIIVEAHHGSVAGPLETKKIFWENSPDYQIAVASASDYALLAYVDANGNGTLDAAYESSGTVAGPFSASTESIHSENISLSAGAAEAGGTVYVTTAVFQGYAGAGEWVQMMKLGLWSEGGGAKFRSIQFMPLGAAATSMFNVTVYGDSNGSGSYDMYDCWLGNSFFINSSTVSSAVSFASDEILGGTTRYYFVFATMGGTNLGDTAGIKISSMPAIGLVQGVMADQSSIYPISSSRTIKLGVDPTMYVFYSGGGSGTGIQVYSGQSLTISATGQWLVQGTTVTALGNPSLGYGGIVGGSPVGSLIAKIGTDPWMYLGTSTTINYSGSGGELRVGMNKCDNCWYSDTSGRLYLDYSLSGSTWAAVSGTITYTGAAGGNIILIAKQGTYGYETAVATHVIPVAQLVSGNTGYYFTGIPASADTLFEAYLESSPGQRGKFPQHIWLAVNTVYPDLSFVIYPGTGSVSGTLAYSGTQNYGDFKLGFYRNVYDMYPSTTLVLSSAGAFNSSAGAIQAPGYYYVLAFRDGNYNNIPDGLEPFGYIGTAGPVADMQANASLISFSSGAVPANLGTITLGDVGQISGYVYLGSLSGRVVVRVGEGSPGASASSFKLANRHDYNVTPCNWANCTNQTWYSIGTLSPATDYAVMAFVDSNSNDTFDPGESFGVSALNLSVSSNSSINADMWVSSSQVPPMPSNFAGVAVSSTQINWTWSDVAGETDYALVSPAGAWISSPAVNSVSFNDTALTPNSVRIGGIRANNAYGGSYVNYALPSVYSLAAVPALSTGAVTDNSVTVSLYANGNPAGTVYEIERSTSSSGGFSLVLSTTMAAVNYSDSGLMHSTVYYYRARAINGNGVRTGDSPSLSALTSAPIGPYISGQMSYSGQQAGSRIVRLFTSNVSTAPLKTVSLAAGSTGYYFGGLANGTSYYVKAFVDVTGNLNYDAGEDTMPSALTVYVTGTGAMTGKDVNISPDVIVPPVPSGLAATPGTGNIYLAWTFLSNVADLLGYEIVRSSYAGAPVISSSQPGGYVSGVAFTDYSPAIGADTYYRIRALDWGKNYSPWSAAVSARATSGGSISGTLSTVDTSTSGIYHVKVSTSPDSSVPAIRDVQAPLGGYVISGLADGIYYVRGYRDVNGNFVQDRRNEPSGTHGGVARPFDLYISQGANLTGIDVNLCDRTPLDAGISSTTNVSSGGCAARDRGPGYYTRIFTFEIGYGAGKIPPGSQLTVYEDSSYGFDSYLYLLGPSGDIVAQDNDSGGNHNSRIMYTASQEGIYLIEPTSYNPGQTDTIAVRMDITGGYSGRISGNISYSGASSGSIALQLYESLDPFAWPVKISTVASKGSFEITGLRDGTYYLKAYRDVNGNGIKDALEPSGAYGISYSSPSAFNVSGGLASFSINLTLADPAMGAVSGSVSYYGQHPGNILIEAAKPKCQGCGANDMVIKGSYTVSRAAVENIVNSAYTISLLEPSTSYTIKAYVDENGNGSKDILEPFISSSPVNVIANSTAPVNLIVANSGNGAAGNSNISGTLYYPPASAGPMWVVFSVDSEFQSILYTVQASSLAADSWSYARQNVTGATYYMAAFIDVNNNGQPDESAGEPIGLYSSGSTGEALPLYVPASSTVVRNLTLSQPPTGQMTGTVYYYGAQSGMERIEASLPDCRGPYCGTKISSAKASNLPFTLNFLPASTSYNLFAYIDVNGNKTHDFGEASVWAPASVSLAGPTTGVQLTIMDPGQFSGGSTIGEIHGTLSYNGIQTGNMIARLFDTSSLTGAVLAVSYASGGSYAFVNLANDAYYLDAFVDANGNGVYDQGFEAYGVIRGTEAVNITQGMSQAWAVNGTLYDPGAVAASTGSNVMSGRIDALSGSAGTVRVHLYKYDSDAQIMKLPVRVSSYAYSSSVNYSFADIPSGSYLVQAFMDANSNFQPDISEAWGQSRAMNAGQSPSSGVNLKICGRTSITAGQTLEGALSTSDCVNPDRNLSSAYADYYSFQGNAGDVVTIEMRATGFSDSYLYLYGPSASSTSTLSSYNLVAYDDDSGGNSDARIFNSTLPASGVYTIAATSYGNAITGAYKVSLSVSGASNGSIAGTVRYNGTQGGKIQLGLFNTAGFLAGNVPAFAGAQMNSAGDFSFANLPSGNTYYIAGFVDVNLNGRPDPGEDTGVYGCLANVSPCAPTPVTLRAGQNVAGIVFDINPSTSAAAGGQGTISGNAAYSGNSTGTLRVEAWSNPQFSGFPVGTRIIATGAPSPFDMLVPGGASYFLRAFLDKNGNSIPDLNTEPSGVYSPNNEGPESVYVSSGAYVIMAGSVTLLDPGQTAGGAAAAGEGTATINVTSASVGAMFNSTIIVIVGASGIQEGGVINIGLPFNFYSSLNHSSPGSNGYVDYGGVNVSTSVQYSSMDWTPNAEIRVKPGASLPAGTQVNFFLNKIYAPCQSGQAVFRVGTSQNSSVQPRSLAAGEPSITLQPGYAQTFSVRNADSSNMYGATVLTGTTSQLVMEGRDMCWNITPSTCLVTAAVSARNYNYAAAVYEPDSSIQFANASDSSFAASTNVPMGAGMSSASFYAVASSTGFKNIEITYNLGYPATFYAGVQVMAGNAISGANVSTGAYSSAFTSVAITPNGDGVSDRAYINFAMSDPNMNWHVLVSSRPFRAGVVPTAVWETWGWGQPSSGQISWDGRYNPWINFGNVVPSGAYFVRIEVGGLKNDSLRVDVQVPQVSGQVTDAATLPGMPISGVTVNAYGPGGGQTVTDSNGNYALPGLAAGTYQFQFAKEGYGAVSTGAAISAAGGSLNVSMRRAPALILSMPPLSPSATQQYEQWGWINIHTANWSRSYNGSLRVQAGTTTFDDGGRWDASGNQFVVRKRLRFDVEPDTYTIEAQLFGYAPSLASVYVGEAGLELTMPAFARKANISGRVTLPGGYVNSAGVWVSVNAMPVSASSAASGGWGGAWVMPGLSSAAYNILGVDPGSYTVSAHLQGYSRVSAPVYILNSDITGLDFSGFDSGGQISGVITVKGDTSKFRKPQWATWGGGWPTPISVYVNLWSQQTYGYGWTQVFLSTDTTQATTSYLITGLDKGATYQMYANMSFEGGGPNEFNLTGLPERGLVYIPQSGTRNLDFGFEMASGTISGTMYLPETPAPDFSKVSMSVRVLNSENPYARRDVMLIPDVTAPDGLPGFQAYSSSASFRVQGLETQTMEVAFSYSRTGISRSYTVSVVNGSTTTAVIDLRGQTYSVSGSIISQVTNPVFNTNAKMVQNSTVTLPSGYPVVSGFLPIEALRREASRFGQALESGFDTVRARVGYISQAGTYTVSGLQEGVYILRTHGLRECSTCEIAIPSQEKVVTIRQSDYDSGNVLVDGVRVPASAVDFTITDGWNVSGTISLENSIQDARTLSLVLRNKRNEVVKSTFVALGNAGAGSYSNSADYAFSRLPAGEFYTLQVTDTVDSGGRIKYAAAPLKFPDRASFSGGLQSDLSSRNVTLKRGAFFTGKLRDVNSGSVVTQTNVTILPPNFTCYAAANPWVQGGYYVAASSIQARPVEYDGTFRIGPVIPDIPYDLHCEQTNWDVGYLRQGSQNFAPAVVSGQTPASGETKDLGVLDLNPGQALTGTVKRRGTNVPLPNIKIQARPSYVENPITVQTVTGRDGRYTLWVSTYVSRYFDVSAAARESNMAAAEGSEIYRENVSRAVDLERAASVDLTLEAVNGGIAGKVETADYGSLSYPFGSMKGFPAAGIFIQPYGTVPSVNPLGDIEAVTGPDGVFRVPGLSTGTYVMRAVSLGYAVSTKTVTVAGDYIVDAGTVTLGKGATVTGRIQKPDSTASGGFASPSETEVGGVAAANYDFTEFVIGSVETDPVSKTVERYTITGFKPGYTYTMALMPQTGNDITFPAEGGSIKFGQEESTATKTMNLTFRPSVADCMAVSKKVGNDQFRLKFRCSKSLRNKTSMDNDLTLILSTSAVDSSGSALSSPNGAGYLLNGTKISSDRKQVTAVYRKAEGESRFSVRLAASVSAIDPSTGENYRLDKVFDFYTGIESVATSRVTNMQGGDLEMEAYEDEEERSRAEFSPGTFAEEGSLNVSATVQITVGIRRARSLEGAQVAALSSGERVEGVNALYSDSKAFPQEMFEAMKALKEQRVGNYRTKAGGSANVTAFSAFYDIFLPAGISHVLKQPARITLSYDLSQSSATDANALDVYYYNPGSRRYVLENNGKSVDAENGTISVNVDHLSVFVVLAQAPQVPAIAYTGTELKAHNFPNPFNLKPKTKATNANAGSGTYAAGPNCDTEGTCIRVFVPAGLSGDMALKIYNMAGELVRADNLTGYAAGSTNVWAWDGRNGAGAQVASGIYIGEIKLGGQKTFFKMAVIKDSRYQ